MMLRAYLAGPLFTHAERFWNLSIAQAIENAQPAIRVFVPQVETAQALRSSPPDFREIQRICLEGIDRSDVVIANLDGADSDSGTCFECGYAYAKLKPVVGVRTDARGSGEEEGLNAMLSQSCARIVRPKPSDDFESVARQISDVVLVAGIEGLLDAHPGADIDALRQWVREFETATSMRGLIDIFERVLEHRKSTS